jgi:uncharacterized membrane protein YjdF
VTPARFALGAAAAVAVFGAAAGERRVAAYLVVLGLCAVPVAMARFTRPVQWALACGGVLHLIGGVVPGRPVFYETWLIGGVLKYDQAAHFAISAIVVVALWEAVGRHVDDAGVRSGIVVLMALGLGALNEVFEFLSALRFADAYVGDAANTAWDLVFNTFGAVTAGLWLAISSRAPSSRGSRTAPAAGAAR